VIDAVVSLPPQRARLGLLVAGSVAEGLSARLDPTVAIEDVRLGKFVKIVGQKYEYFCLVTDVQLDSANAMCCEIRRVIRVASTSTFARC